MKKTKKLSIRIAMYCIIFAYIISIVIGVIGYKTYYDNNLNHYKEYIHTVVDIALGEVDAEDIMKCIEAKEKSEGYNQIQMQFNNIKRNSKIAYLYMIEPKENGKSKYVLAGYKENEVVGTLGEYIEDDFDNHTVNEFLLSIQNQEEIKYIKNKFGTKYMITGVIPIINKDGTSTMIIGADIFMDNVYSELIKYIAIVSVGTAVLVTVFTIIFVKVLNKSMVKPIINLGKYADEFVLSVYLYDQSEELVFKDWNIKSGDEIENLSNQIKQMMKAIIEYTTNIRSITSEQERLHTQLNIAKEIQHNILPLSVLDNGMKLFSEKTEFDIYALMKPAEALGGDFYDFFLIDEEHLCIVIADVEGTGVPAALFMMMAKTLIKNYASIGFNPSQVFHKVNNQLCENNNSEITVKAFMGILNIINGEFQYVSAGENNFYFKKSGEILSKLEVEYGFLLGALENVPYTYKVLKLNQGDMLFLFTEGIKRVSNDHEESYVNQYLMNAFSQAVSQQYELKEILECIEKDRQEFTGDHKQLDDITMLMLRYLG